MPAYYLAMRLHEWSNQMLSVSAGGTEPVLASAPMQGPAGSLGFLTVYASLEEAVEMNPGVPIQTLNVVDES